MGKKYRMVYVDMSGQAAGERLSVKNSHQDHAYEVFIIISG